MKRSDARELALHLIYAAQCSELSADQLLSERLSEEYFGRLAEEHPVYREFPDAVQQAYIEETVRGVLEHREELDGYISKYSLRWSVQRLSKLSRSILELAMYEAVYTKDVPVNAAIHEAVLLAKRYEEAETAAYINGVLGSFSREEPVLKAEEAQP